MNEFAYSTGISKSRKRSDRTIIPSLPGIAKSLSVPRLSKGRANTMPARASGDLNTSSLREIILFILILTDLLGNDSFLRSARVNQPTLSQDAKRMSLRRRGVMELDHGYFRDRLGAEAVAERKHKNVINPNLVGSGVNSILRDRSTIRFLHTPLDNSITRAHDNGGESLRL